MSQQELRQKITDQIVLALESGDLPPWRRPWQIGPNCGLPANVSSRKTYSGINPILLELSSAAQGFSSRWWGTYKQWSAMGGQVRSRPNNVPPGMWGTQIVFWSPIKKKTTNEQGEDEESSFFVMRTYTVFNIDQVDGEGLDHLRADSTPDEPEVIDDSAAEHAIKATEADIRFGGNKAFYSPSGDYIQMPPKSSFVDGVGDGYYPTLFHELVHWTEHSTRLNWSRKEKENSYAMGELVAEIGACYLSRELGLKASEDLTNHIAYVKQWLEAMKNDSRFIFKASAQASKAADYILAFSRTEAEVEMAV